MQPRCGAYMRDPDGYLIEVANNRDRGPPGFVRRAIVQPRRGHDPSQRGLQQRRQIQALEQLGGLRVVAADLRRRVAGDDHGDPLETSLSPSLAKVR